MNKTHMRFYNFSVEIVDEVVDTDEVLTRDMQEMLQTIMEAKKVTVRLIDAQDYICDTNNLELVDA
jgi:hypothetical protein